MWAVRTIVLVLLAVMITGVGTAQTSAAQNNAPQRLQDKSEIQALGRSGVAGDSHNGVGPKRNTPGA